MTTLKHLSSFELDPFLVVSQSSYGVKSKVKRPNYYWADAEMDVSISSLIVECKLLLFPTAVHLNINISR